MMRLLQFMLLTVVLSLGSQAYAQEEAPLTDEEITRYANLMLFADAEKEAMKERYNEWIQSNETLEAQRFVDIKAAEGDEAKLAELAVTEEEMAAFTAIQERYDNMVAAFKEEYTAMIKDDEQVGVSLYNRMRKELKGDEELEARYDAIYAELVARQEVASEADAEGSEGN